MVAVVAMAPGRVIGRDNRVPWHRPADLRRFKALTVGGTVVMGRNTHESIGRPLPGRTHVVVTSRGPIDGAATVSSLEQALALGDGALFVIGGAQIYAEALAQDLLDEIDLTHVPDRVEGAVHFPRLDPERWVAGPLSRLPEDPELWIQRFRRR